MKYKGITGPYSLAKVLLIYLETSICSFLFVCLVTVFCNTYSHSSDLGIQKNKIQGGISKKVVYCFKA